MAVRQTFNGDKWKSRGRSILSIIIVIVIVIAIVIIIAISIAVVIIYGKDLDAYMKVT